MFLFSEFQYPVIPTKQLVCNTYQVNSFCYFFIINQLLLNPFSIQFQSNSVWQNNSLRYQRSINLQSQQHIADHIGKVSLTWSNSMQCTSERVVTDHSTDECRCAGYRQKNTTKEIRLSVFLQPRTDKLTHRSILTQFYRDCRWSMETMKTALRTNPTSMPMRDKAAVVRHWTRFQLVTWEMIFSF